MSWNFIRNFKPSEFAAPDKMDEGFMLKLDRIRDRCGFPLKVNSSWRATDEQGALIQTGVGARDSAHTRIPCRAVDLSVLTSGHRYVLVREALSEGIRRIGIGKTFVHLDDDPELPQEVLWLYE